MSLFRRYVPRLVLAAAAAASIATSDVRNEWFLDDETPLVRAGLDDPRPESVQVIRAVVSTGDDPPLRPNGNMRVHVELIARDVTGVQPAQVEVALRSVAREAEVDLATVSIAAGGRATADLLLPAWADCADRICVEEFTLTLRRSEAGGDPIIDAQGTARIDFFAEGTDVPPDGALIDIETTDPEPMQ